jgi:F420-dependent methylenetetrahydromethanopterin dehydrogenase
VELPVATLAAGPVRATAIPPVISIAATSASKVEGQTGTTAFTFTVTRDVGEGVSSVSWSLVHGNTAETDFSGATNGVVSFAVGETSKVITLNVVGDTAIELDGAFSVLLSGPDGATLGTATATGTILNDDLGSISIAAVVGSRQEGQSGASAFTYAVTRTTDVGTATVNWAVAHGTTVATDFSGTTSGTVTFAAGEMVKLITVSALGDTLVESDEAFDVVLSGAVGATLGTVSAAGTILNDDLPAVSIVATPVSKAEGTGAAGTTTPFTFTVSRNNSLGTSQVSWTVLHGTTTAADFSGPTSGVVSFLAGETSKTISVNVVADSTIELNESFSVRLSGTRGSSLGAGSVATATIVNDDLPTVSIAATSTNNIEGNTGTTPFTFTVTRSSAVGTSSVNWAVQHMGTSAADFTGATNGTVSFLAGETSKVITLAAVGETAIELDEAFNVVLSAPNGAQLGTATAAGSILADDLPTVSIAAASASKAEGTSTLAGATTAFTFTVSRNTTLGTSSVNYALVLGTATADDFSGATTGTVSFASGESSKTVTVNVLADSTIELAETFSVTLSAPVGALLGTATAAGSITNDDLPTVSVAATSAVNAEGAAGGTTPYTFTISRNSGVGESSVNWSVAHAGTAADDFTGALSGSVAFAAGETSKVITVTALGDATIELSENFSVVLSTPVGAKLGTSSATGTLVNDDLPTVSIAATSATKAEGSTGTTPFTFTVTRTSGVGTASVGWAVAHVDTVAADFSGATGGTVSFAAGETSKVITLNVVGDTAVELNEGFNVVLSSPTNALLGTTTAAGVVQADDVPTVSIAATSASKAEGSTGTTAFTFTVTRSSGVGTSSVNYALAHGTTTADDVSGTTSGTVSFASGETSKLVTINVVGDTTIELNETFSVALTNPVGATLGTATATGTVVNDDLPTVSIVATSANLSEGSTGTTPFTFTVTRSSGVGASSVNWAVAHTATAAADFSGATSGALSFVAGETSKTVTVNAVGDTTIELNEGFNVVLSSPTGAKLGTATAAGTIFNDDLPTVSIAATSANKAEGNTGTTGFTFTVTRSSNVGTSSVNWAVANTNTVAADFSGSTSGVVSFLAGETSKVITVSVVGETTIELNEAFNVVLTSPTGAVLGTATATGTIVNDDLPTVSIAATSASKAEGSTGTTPFTFTVTRSSGVGTSSVNYAVSHVGTSADDFSGATSGTVSFLAGETSKVITLNVVGDTTIELNEAFNVVLSSAAGATLGTATAAGQVTNDDLPTVSIAATSADKAEGSSGGTTAFTFTVTRSSGVGTASVGYALVHGTTVAADFSGTTTGTVSFLAGETSKVITVYAVADTVIEDNETFSVTLSAPVGATLGTATAAGRLVNDDVPVLSLSATSADKVEGNTGTTPFTFTVTRNVGTGVSSVGYAVVHGSTSASDFSGSTAGTVSFADGETSKVITLNVLGDTVGEGNETFSVALSGASNATISTSTAAGTIRNDDSGGVGGILSSISQVTYITVPAEVPDNIDNLVDGAKWGGAIGTGAQLTYSFSTSASDFSYSNSTHDPFTALNVNQQAAARMAMNALSAVCNLTFTEVADTAVGAGDIRWTLSQNATLSTAHAYYPSTSAAGGDIWFGPGDWYTTPEVGGYSYHTFIHELGHAVGLEHPHDGSPVPVVGEDQLKYSVMSYKDNATDTNDGYGSSYFPTTYMLNDIAALQYLYGINASTNPGNNVYTWGATSKVYECLWDTGGVDTVDASSQTLSVTINLNGGTWSTIGASYSNEGSTVRNSLGIAYDVVTGAVDSRIEDAIGTAQADTLIGNAVANTLTGGAGADTLTGGAGADVFRFVTTTQGGDTLTDFTSGSDRIQVVSSNFGALPVGTLASSRFVSSGAPTALDANAVFLYNSTTGVLTFDSNGTGAGGTTVVATLASGFRTLVAGDIQVAAA